MSDICGPNEKEQCQTTSQTELPWLKETQPPVPGQATATEQDATAADTHEAHIAASFMDLGNTQAVDASDAGKAIQSASTQLDKADSDFQATRGKLTPPIRQEYEAALKAADAVDTSDLQHRFAAVNGELPTLNSRVSQTISSLENKLSDEATKKQFETACTDITQAAQQLAVGRLDATQIAELNRNIEQQGQALSIIFRGDSAAQSQANSLVTDIRKTATATAEANHLGNYIHFSAFAHLDYAKVLALTGDANAAAQEMDKIHDSTFTRQFFNTRLIALTNQDLEKQSGTSSLTPEVKALFDKISTSAKDTPDEKTLLNNLPTSILEALQTLDNARTILASNGGVATDAYTVLLKQAMQQADTQYNHDRGSLQTQIDKDTKLSKGQEQGPVVDELRSLLAHQQRERLPGVLARAYLAQELAHEGKTAEANKLILEAMNEYGGAPQDIIFAAKVVQQQEGLDAAKLLYEMAVHAAQVTELAQQKENAQFLSAWTIANPLGMDASEELANIKQPVPLQFLPLHDQLLANAPFDTRYEYALQLALSNSNDKAQGVKQLEEIQSNYADNFPVWSKINATLQWAQSNQAGTVNIDEINNNVANLKNSQLKNYGIAGLADLAVTGSLTFFAKDSAPIGGALAMTAIYAGLELYDGRVPNATELRNMFFTGAAIPLELRGIGWAAESAVDGYLVRRLGPSALRNAPSYIAKAPAVAGELAPWVTMGAMYETWQHYFPEK